MVYGGERVFAAGADVKEMADMSYTDMVKRSTGLTTAFTAVARIPKPVVAAVTGYALGGGCELALCADIRIAADNATLGQPEILLGIIPGAGGTQRLSRLVGPSRAKDIIFTGRFVKADEALAIGLVDRLVPGRRGLRRGRGAGRASSQRRDVRRPRGQGGRSTGASRSTSRPGWRSSASSSPHCSPPRTAPSGWARSSRTDRARPSSRVADPPTPADPAGPRAHAPPTPPQESTVSPKVRTEADEDRSKRTHATQNEIRSKVARVVRLVFGVLATILALGAFLVVLRNNINEHNAIVKLVTDVADAISGPFSRDDGIFDFSGKNAVAKNALLNWGIAAIVYLLLGRLPGQRHRAEEQPLTSSVAVRGRCD